MKQRLHLARALLGRPQLLLLDEPTTGLDPDIAHRVRSLVGQIAASGVAVLLTSHSMAEVEELAHVITVIGAGQIAVRGDVADVANYAGIAGITTFSLPASASALLRQLVEKLGDDAVVTWREVAGQWAVELYWRRLPQPDRVLALLPHCPQDLVNRAASLEEAYLAIAERLAR
nr:AAA family ATPase [Buchananella hordeovulneris]